jgi:hypothetical protein
MFVIRSVSVQPLPKFAVVETWDLGGKDIGWFFTERDAQDYQEFLKRKQSEAETILRADSTAGSPTS